MLIVILLNVFFICFIESTYIILNQLKGMLILRDNFQICSNGIVLIVCKVAIHINGSPLENSNGFYTTRQFKLNTRAKLK